MGFVRLLIIELLKDLEGAELGEVGEVEAVVGEQDFEDSGSLQTVQAEKVHRGKVHAHEEANVTGFLG